jgi:predicted RNA-binding Zn ribbon-like protein
LVVTRPHIAALELRGGDLSLDFANTLEGALDGPPGTEHLEDYDDLVAWAHHAHVLDATAAQRLTVRAARDPRAAGATLRAARDLREAIHATFAAVARGEAPPAAPLAAVRDAAAVAVAHAELAAAAVHWHGNELDRPLWPVALAALDLLRDGDRLARVKSCGQCVWLFVDRSRNRSRRWCSMDECGAQVKMRRYRAAHRH